MRRVIVTLVIAAMLLVAVPAVAVAHDVVAQDATTTQAPPDTEAPGTTDGEGSDGNDADWWVLLIVLLGVVVLVWAIARSGRNKNVYVAPMDPGWKPKARDGYADGRWLYDTMTEDIAIWRGNAQYDGTTELGSTAETGKAAAWDSLAGRMDRARDALYGLEAAAPDRRSAQTARSLVTALSATRVALDARAEARFNFRKVDATEVDEGTRPQLLAEARDRELRTGQNLSAERRSVAEALSGLSTLT